MRRRLTDRTIDALKPRSNRYEIWDEVVPGLGVRVDAKGGKTFVVVKRFPGAKYPTRRAIGHYGVIGLAEARDEAREVIKLILKGIDPVEEAHVLHKPKPTIALARLVRWPRTISASTCPQNAEAALTRVR